MRVLYKQESQISSMDTETEGEAFINRVHFEVFRRGPAGQPLSLEQLIQNCEQFCASQAQGGNL